MKMENGEWKMENEPVAAISDCHNSRSGGVHLRPFQIMNYRRGNPCGYPFLLGCFIFILTIMFCANLYSQTDVLSHYIDIAEQNNHGVQSAFTLYKASLERVHQVAAIEPLVFEIGLFTPPMHAINAEQIAQFQVMQMFNWFGTRRAGRTEMEQMAIMAFEEYRETRDQLRLDVTTQWFTLSRLNQQLKNNQANKLPLQNLEELAIRRFSSPNINSSMSDSGSMSMNMPSAPAAPSSMTGMSGMGNMGGMGGMSGTMPVQTTQRSTANMSNMPSMSGNMEMGNSSVMVAVLRLQIEIAEINFSIESLLTEINAETVKFNSLLNRPLDTEITFPESLIKTPFSLDIDTAMEIIRLQNPMLNMYLAEEAAFLAKEDMDKRMGLPMFGLGVQYMLNREAHHALMPSEPNGANMIMPMAMITIPLFRGQYRAQQRENILLRQASRSNYENMHSIIEAELYLTKNRLENTELRIELYQRQIEILNSIHNLALQEFTSGSGDMSSVIQAQRQLLDYELMTSEAIADFNIMVAQIQKLISSSHKMEDK